MKKVNQKVTYYKEFDKDLRCRGMQFDAKIFKEITGIDVK